MFKYIGICTGVLLFTVSTVYADKPTGFYGEYVSYGTNFGQIPKGDEDCARFVNKRDYDLNFKIRINAKKFYVFGAEEDFSVLSGKVKYNNAEGDKTSFVVISELEGYGTQKGYIVRSGDKFIKIVLHNQVVDDKGKKGDTFYYLCKIK